MKTLLLTLLLIPALSLPVLAAPTPAHIMEKAKEAFKAQAEKELCPSQEGSEEEDEIICFVREVAIQGSFAAVRLAYQNQADSFVVYNKPKEKWTKILAQPWPDWEAAAEFETPVPQSVFTLLAKTLFPPEEAGEE